MFCFFDEYRELLSHDNRSREFDGETERPGEFRYLEDFCNFLSGYQGALKIHTGKIGRGCVCGSHYYGYIADKLTAKEAWDALIAAFEDSGVCRKVSLLQQLVSLKMKDCSNMEDYVNKMTQLWSKVQAVGFRLGEDVVGSLMLGGLPNEFRPMIMGIENSGKTISVDFVKNLLLQEVIFDCGASGSEAALMAKKKINKKRNRKVKCFECGGPHYKKDCPDKGQGKNKVLLAMFSADNCSVSSVDEPINCSGRDEVLQASFLADNCSDSTWYIDSGATAHMTNRREFISNKRKPIKAEVIVANSQSIKVECICDVRQKCNDGTEVLIKDVQYIPGLCASLLSVSQIVKSDMEVIFNKNGCKIVDKNSKIIATGSLINNMFTLDAVPIVKDFACASKFQDNDLELWHKRFGHANVQKVKLLLDLKNINKQINEFKCATCVKGKQSRKPFNADASRATNLLELIHSDVCGPTSVKSIGGGSYYVIFVDDFSRKVFAYVIKSKGEVFNKFVDFKNFVEKQTGKNIKALCRIFEFELRSISCCAWTRREKSAPYTPQQNGLAERMNQTIVEKVRCLLFEAGLEKVFWGEAVLAAADIVNVLPNSANGNKIPNEVWYGKKPDLSMFKVFGCRAMAKIPDEKRKKLDSKSAECILLRIEPGAKAFRLYDRETKKVIISRDVVFFENERNSVNPVKDFNYYFPCFDEISGETVEADIRAADSGEKSDDVNESTTGNDTTIHEVSGDETLDDSNGSDDFVNARQDDSDDPSFRTRASIPDASTRPVTRGMNIFNFLQNHQADLAFMIDEPNTYKQAIESEEKDDWNRAMKEEFDSLIQNETWELVSRPLNECVVTNRWVFKRKINTDGSIERFKARLVARGFTQEYGVNYYETFSPVVRFTSIRMMVAIAVNRKMKIKQFDVKTAFLYGELSENVFMKQPKGFEDGTNRVCKLRKSLYGLKQASRCWNRRFKYFIEVFGFVACPSDPCVFVSNRNNSLMILAIHVDDGLIISDSDEDIHMVIIHLQKQFEIKVMQVGCFLGIQIEKNKDGSIFIHQQAYAQKVLNRFEMNNCNTVCVPSDPSQVLHEFAESELSVCSYREMVGSLMYLAVATRPDISFSVGLVSRFLEKPTIVHENAVRRILKYLKGTLKYGILYSGNHDEKLLGYSDADYAGDNVTRRSTSGFAFLYGNGIISWCSERQKSVSLSTTESEYIAASNAVKELVWLKRILNELLDKNVDVVFHMDNQSAIRLIKNPEFHKRSKHIDVRYHFIREKFEENCFKLEFLPSNEMIADIFTKPLAKDKFEFFRSLMNVEPKTNSQN